MRAVVLKHGRIRWCFWNKIGNLLNLEVKEGKYNFTHPKDCNTALMKQVLPRFLRPTKFLFLLLFLGLSSSSSSTFLALLFRLLTLSFFIFLLELGLWFSMEFESTDWDLFLAFLGLRLRSSGLPELRSSSGSSMSSELMAWRSLSRWPSVVSLITKSSHA